MSKSRSPQICIRKHLVPYLQRFGTEMGLTGMAEIVNRVIEDHQAFHLQNGRPMVAVSPLSASPATGAIASAPKTEPTYSPALEELIESDFVEVLGD